MTNPSEVAAAYDSVADQYDSSYAQKKSIAENRVVLGLVRRLLSVEGLVADLGCGTGFLLDHIDLATPLYFGVDVSPAMIARARAKHPDHRFEVGRMEESLIQTSSIDVALSLFGGFSYADPDAAEREIWRILKPGGVFLVMMLGPRYRSRASYILNKANIEVPKHLYSAKSARQLFGRFEFVNVSGLRALVDALPERLPQALFDWYLILEQAFWECWRRT
jgi:ubiquinone/menaquinone biosynthesis C-methylase UbiE